jgi:leucyl-tRNA synthetase
MFAAPPEQTLEWSDDGVKGAYRFLRRLWDRVQAHVADGAEPQARVDVHKLDGRQKELRKRVHDCIAKVSDDIGRRYTFNTAIAATMELVNAVGHYEVNSDDDRLLVQEALENIVLLLAPIVPHLCHHLWLQLGNAGPVIDTAWPQADEQARSADSVTLVIQVNGKLRARIVLAADASRDDVEAAALADENVQRFVAGKDIRKVVIVPGKLVNVVV